jgi:ADP-heptose:LPS heptosyltransferase
MLSPGCSGAQVTRSPRLRVAGRGGSWFAARVVDDPGDGPVLVLRALGLGDLLVTVPALRALRRHYPDRTIVLATSGELAPLALLSGAVDEVLPTGTPDGLRWPAAAGPAVAVNLHGAGPQSHRALDRTHPRRRIGCRSPGWDGPPWSEIERGHRHQRERWCALLSAHGVRADPADLRLPPPPPPPEHAGAAIVHPGARYGAKRWPPERFAAVVAALRAGALRTGALRTGALRTGALRAGALRAGGQRVVLTGSAAERPLALAVAAAAGLAETTVLAGRTDPAQLTALVAHAGLLVCGDTGVAHLASAFGTPSVVLFGPVGPAEWGPPVDGPHRALTDGTVRRGDPFADDPDPALLGVPVPEVLDAISRLAAGPGPMLSR